MSTLPCNFASSMSTMYSDLHRPDLSRASYRDRRETETTGDVPVVQWVVLVRHELDHVSGRGRRVYGRDAPREMIRDIRQRSSLQCCPARAPVTSLRAQPNKKNRREADAPKRLRALVRLVRLRIGSFLHRGAAFNQRDRGRAHQWTHESQMVEFERRPRARVAEPLGRTLHAPRVADDHLRPLVSMRGRRTHTRTWCLCPGTSTVTNCATLYSSRAGWMPSCSDSSSEMMFRTSGKCLAMG